MIKFSLITRLLLTSLLTSAVCTTQAAEESLPHVEVQRVVDFSELARLAKDQQKLIMLQVSASDCNYCSILEEALVKPMLRSGDYDKDVLIRRVDIDSKNRLSGFDGQSISGAQVAKMFNIKVTPTLIFLNSKNQEVSKRIVGVNSLDYMGAYVDSAIKQGLSSIR